MSEPLTFSEWNRSDCEGHFGAVHLQGALATMQSMGIDPRGLIVWREPDVGVYGARFFKARGRSDSKSSQDGEWIFEAL